MNADPHVSLWVLITDDMVDTPKILEQDKLTAWRNFQAADTQA